MSELLKSLGIDPKIIGIQFIGFLILFFVLKQFLFTKILNIVSERQKNIEDEYKKIELQNQEIQKLQDDYKRHLENIQDEMQEKIQEAIKEGEKLKIQILDNAREEAEKLTLKTKREIEIEKEKAFFELKNQISNFVIKISSKIIEEELSEEKHNKLIERFIDELPSQIQ